MEISDIFDILGLWTWWVIAAILLVLELLAPGVFFMWLAFAAAVVAANSLFIDWPWEAQVATFAILSLVSVVASRMFLQRKPISSDRPFLNRRMDRMVGQTYTIAEAIEHGEGRVRVGDSMWPAKGPDCDVGTRVRVNNVADGVLYVEPAKAEDAIDDPVNRGL